MNLISKKYQKSRSIIKSASFLDVSPTSKSVEIGNISETTNLKFLFEFAFGPEFDSADELVTFENDAKDDVKTTIDGLSTVITSKLKNEDGFETNISNETTTLKYSIQSSKILLTVEVKAEIKDLDQVSNASSRLKEIIESEIPGIMTNLEDSSFEEDETDQSYSMDYMSEKVANLKSIANLYRKRYHI